MDCPDCGMPNVERLNTGTFDHWCPARTPGVFPGVPVQNERRRYAPDDRALMTAEWLDFIESLPTTEDA